MQADQTIHDLAARIETLEATLEDLQSRIETCRQAMILSRAAIGLGFATIAIVSTLATAYSSATVVLAAFTAIIGGIVWLGSSKSSKEALEAERAGIEARKNSLFDQIAVRNGWVGDARTYH